MLWQDNWQKLFLTVRSLQCTAPNYPVCNFVQRCYKVTLKWLTSPAKLHANTDRQSMKLILGSCLYELARFQNIGKYDLENRTGDLNWRKVLHVYSNCTLLIQNLKDVVHCLFCKCILDEIVCNPRDRVKKPSDLPLQVWSLPLHLMSLQGHMSQKYP